MTGATGTPGERPAADHEDAAGVPDDERAVGEVYDSAGVPVPDAEREVPLDLDDRDTGPPVVDDPA